MDIPRSFGTWLKEWRQRRDLTQAEVARQVGCSANLIHKIETGTRRPSRDLATLLVARLGLPPTDQPAFVQWARGGPAPPVLPVRNVQSFPLAPLPPAAALPLPLTAWIRREAEQAQVRVWLDQPTVRLITLIGPPGVGKTRLAVTAAASGAGAFRDGVGFVSLAPLADPALVAPTIARAMGVEDDSPHVLRTLQAVLRDRQMLLVLDNFEHLLAAAPIVIDLLQAAPHVRILATSRAALQIPGEHRLPVPPLALPAPAQALALTALAAVESIALFVDRAQQVNPAFALTTENAASVAAICRSLEGLPLAIELAAAWSRLLPPATLLEHLESRLLVLTGGQRDLPARPQTLQCAIGSSYDLLTPPQQAVFRRLGVFCGSATLAAMVVVVGKPGGSDVALLADLAALVDQSLLQHHPLHASHLPLTARYTLLEMLGEYAVARLVETGEEDMVRRRHVLFFLDLAEQARPASQGRNQALWLARLEEDHDNLRGALDWATVAAPELAVRLAAALWWFWLVRGYLREGRARLAQALAAAPPAQTPAAQATLTLARLGVGHLTQQLGDDAAQADFAAAYDFAQMAGDTVGAADALYGLSLAAGRRQDLPVRRAYLERSLALYQEAGQPWGMANAIRQLGMVVRLEEDYPQARRLFEQSLALYHVVGDRGGSARSINNLGLLATVQQDYAEAQSYYRQSLDLCRELGDRIGTAVALLNLGEIAWVLEDLPAARAFLEESVLMFQDLGTDYYRAHALLILGHVTSYQGELAPAWRAFAISLRLSLAQGDRPGLAEALEGLAGLRAATTPVQAARLLGAVARLRTEVPPTAEAVRRQTMTRILATVRSRLNEATFAAAWAAGQALTLDEASAEALAHLPGEGEQPSPRAFGFGG